jgi:ribosomal protein S18 acetylase RimI-like enzyme
MSMVRIDVLDHKDPGVARQIHAVLIPAYAQEAALLRTSNFPPLDRTVEDVQSEEGRYLGAVVGGVVVGALHYESDEEPGQVLIASLVVHPSHQRQGIASALITEALRIEDQEVFAVSTGVKNIPAIALYRGFGFKEYRFGTIGLEALPLVKLRRTPQGL